ncbi:MAG: hypothetical protein AAF756_15140 [Pseudomonadota bacterium]
MNEIPTQEKQLRELAERLELLEKKIQALSSATFFRRLSEYGGLAALVLSVVIAVFTIYDRVITLPNEKSADEHASVRKSIYELSQINAYVNNLPWQFNRQFAIQSANAQLPRRKELLSYLVPILSKNPGTFDFEDHSIVLNEFEFHRDHQEASKHLKLVRTLDLNIIERSSLLAYEARIRALMGDFDGMEELFDKATDILKEDGNTAFQWSRLEYQIAKVRIYLENRRCENAKSSQSLLKEYIDQEHDFSEVRYNIIKQHDDIVVNYKYGCDIKYLGSGPLHQSILDRKLFDGIGVSGKES